MPSLNLKTRSLRYSVADANAIAVCDVLLNAIIEYDPSAKSDAQTAKGALQSVANHIKRQRGEATK